MFDNLSQGDQGILNGALNINDIEIEYMMGIYAQFGAGYDVRLNKTTTNSKTRKTIGEKLWENMTIDERKKEFFGKLKEDMEFTSKYVYEHNRINYFLDRSNDPLDPMAGFYKLLLVRLGASIAEDGKIKVTPELKERLENNLSQNKQIIDGVACQSIDQSLKHKSAGPKLTLKLQLDRS